VNSRNLVPYFVGLLITGFVVFLAYLVFFVPKIAEAQSIQKQATDQRIFNDDQARKVSAVLAKAGNLPDLLKEGEVFHSSFPQGTSQQDLLNSVMAAGAESGVTVSGLTTALPASMEAAAPAPAPAAASAAKVDAAPAPAQPAAAPATGASDSPMASVALTINAEGEPGQLKAFVAKLESLRRPMKIESFSLNDEAGKSTLHVTAESYLTAPLQTPAS
jgi:Tfp pilus assembly protein PilO